jgi:hypothetical protein
VRLGELLDGEALEWTDEPFPDGNERVEVGEQTTQLREPLLRDSDLDVLVLARRAAAEEVERPAGRDVPREVEIREPLRRHRRMPCVPELQVRRERVVTHG